MNFYEILGITSAFLLASAHAIYLHNEVRELRETYVNEQEAMIETATIIMLNRAQTICPQAESVKLIGGVWWIKLAPPSKEMLQFSELIRRATDDKNKIKSCELGE